MKRNSILLLLLFGINCARVSDPYDPIKDQQGEILFQLVNGVTSSSQNSLRPEVISNIEQSDGSIITLLRSTAADTWTNYSFQSRSLSNSNFDISFQRFKVRTNGGATNPSGKGGACRSNTTNFPGAGVTSTNLNCTEFVLDINGQAEVIGGGGASYVGSDVLTNFDTGWFIYDIPTLSPRMTVFVIRSFDGNRYYALQVIDYYSDAGTSGYPRIRWREINF
ncbi:HmuY family protein [Leptospira sp. GIMC2001]|uniref:HmuY family protein n=1 Tax=Leptospira sp. GIMC2001 TaxID=1513297 RepID=UPI00234B6888|nr:HmuY family protein [Leptospira sp. GIMC2001]WCL49544.1 HmuY family protein [Leptospira sp. GIMC2001]